MSISVSSTLRSKAMPLSSNRWQSAIRMPVLSGASRRMATLPVFIYYSYTQPGVPAEFGQARAWGAALVLIAIVMALNLLARLLGRILSPKTAR